MSTRKQHCEDCRQKLGKDWNIVHRWLDEFARQTWPSDAHRAIRHHQAGVEEVRHKWGDEAAEAAEIHILADVAVYGLDHVPTMDEIEQIVGRGVSHAPDGWEEKNGILVPKEKQ